MRPASLPAYVVDLLKPPSWFSARTRELKERLQKLNTNNPEVSIIIPAYNEEDAILRTLTSLSGTKTRYGVEVIVVDNGSTDATKDLVLQSGAKYIYEPQKGVVNARNTGLSHATGTYIINADADTVYSPYWVESLINPLDTNEEVAVTHGKFAFIPEDSYKRFDFYLYEMASDVFKFLNGLRKDKAMYVYGCSSAYRRSQGLQVNGYHHPPGANEDGYLALKLRNEFGKIHSVTHSKSFAWTSCRKFLAEGSLRQRSINKIKNMLKSV